MIDLTSRREPGNPEIMVASLSGELTVESCEYFMAWIEQTIAKGMANIVVDCSDLEFVSSMGLGMIVRIHGKMKSAGGEVRLASVHSRIISLMKVVRLHGLLGIDDSVESAIATIRGGTAAPAGPPASE